MYANIVKKQDAETKKRLQLIENFYKENINLTDNKCEFMHITAAAIERVCPEATTAKWQALATWNLTQMEAAYATREIVAGS